MQIHLLSLAEIHYSPLILKLFNLGLQSNFIQKFPLSMQSTNEQRFFEKNKFNEIGRRQIHLLSLTEIHFNPLI